MYFTWLFINPLLISSRSHYLGQFMEKITDFTLKFEETFHIGKPAFNRAEQTIVTTKFWSMVLSACFLALIFYLYYPCISGGKESCVEYYDRLRAFFAFAGVSLGYIANFCQDTVTICLFQIVENMLSEVSFQVPPYQFHLILQFFAINFGFIT